MILPNQKLLKLIQVGKQEKIQFLPKVSNSFPAQLGKFTLKSILFDVGILKFMFSKKATKFDKIFNLGFDIM